MNDVLMPTVIGASGATTSVILQTINPWLSFLAALLTIVYLILQIRNLINAKK
jgi:hypothetical protein|tara:strand:+ start:549 stop:707 length:159 start_codon:yes stop_codon:yes gene_type:complete